MEHAAARVPLGEHCGDVAPRHPGQRGPGLPAGLQRAEGMVGEEHRAAAAGGRGGQQPAIVRGVVEGRAAQCEGAAVVHGRKGVENRHGALDGCRAAVVPADHTTSRSRRRWIAVPARQSHQKLHRRAPRSLWAYRLRVSGVGESSSQVKAKCSAATRLQSSCFHGGAATASSSVDLYMPDEYRAEPVLPAAQHRGHLGDVVPGVAHAAPPGRRRDIRRPCRPGRSRAAGAVAQLPPAQPPGRRRQAVDPRRRRTVARGRERSPRTVQASWSRSGRFRATCRRAPRRRRAAQAWPGPKPGPGRSRAAAGRRRRGAPGSGRCAVRRPAAARTTRGRRRSRS